MNIARWAGIVTTCLTALASARAADNSGVERLATCQDSWFEWKQHDPARLQQFTEGFGAAFLRKGNDPFFVPRSSQSIAGLSVAQVFPGSVGMGVGFSVVVNAGFETAKATIERAAGKRLGKCETGDNMRMCELAIAEQKTLTLMAENNPKSTTTLVGCYYFYEK